MPRAGAGQLLPMLGAAAQRLPGWGQALGSFPRHVGGGVADCGQAAEHTPREQGAGTAVAGRAGRRTASLHSRHEQPQQPRGWATATAQGAAPHAARVSVSCQPGAAAKPQTQTLTLTHPPSQEVVTERHQQECEAHDAVVGHQAPVFVPAAATHAPSGQGSAALGMAPPHMARGDPEGTQPLEVAANQGECSGCTAQGRPDHAAAAPPPPPPWVLIWG
jgi:hypothetical protein